MSPSRLHELHEAGQSIWLDYIDRPMLFNGDLELHIREDALMGMTSNPTIFEKALAEGSAYDEQLSAAPADHTPWELFEAVASDDVRRACDIFLPVYEQTNGRDGFVSLEVSPGAANDAEESIAEARRLWALVDRPNVMIKVPGTAAGALAVRSLIGEGINVNITLLFSIDAYREVIEAHMAGLEDRLASGRPIDRIASVASFFVSRVDTEGDRRIASRLADASPGESGRLRALEGRLAIANAQLAYALFRDTVATDRWQALAARGARVQRPLWASTSTKNPAYRDVRYVEELIGPDTVNTLPPKTLEAFKDHGVVRRTVDADIPGARAVVDELDALGISLEDITRVLLIEGLASFGQSFDELLAGLERKMRALTHASS
ncbi:MAG TPA: transaldolase [Gemmatimonadaceae bacterium]|nr:transaldolase [Gemmatimonadaceae bacterium]